MGGGRGGIASDQNIDPWEEEQRHQQEQDIRHQKISHLLEKKLSGHRRDTKRALLKVGGRYILYTVLLCFVSCKINMVICQPFTVKDSKITDDGLGVFLLCLIGEEGTVPRQLGTIT